MKNPSCVHFKKSRLLGIVMICLFVEIANTQVNNITHPGGSPYATLQAAINNPSTIAGDVLKFTLNLNEGLITINKAVEIDGNGYTLTSSSASYGLFVTIASVNIHDLKVEKAGTFGIHVNCGSHNLIMTNVVVDDCGSTGVALNGSDNAVITNLVSTNNGGNGMSITNCDNTTVNGITTSGNSFGGGFNAGIGIFTSNLFCLPAGVNGFALTGTVNISEVTKVYSQKANVADPMIGFSGASIQWAVGVGLLDRSYWPDKSTSYVVVDALFEAPYNYPNTAVYVSEVSTENFYVNDDPNGDNTPPMLIQTAIGFEMPGKTIFVEEGTYKENVIVNKSLSILGPNSNIDPCSGSRVPEAIVVPSSAAISSGEIFHVAASNVTIKGFTIDGDNTAITSGFTSTNGADIDAAEGITVYETGINNLTVINNIIKNLSYFGVTLYDYPAGVPSSGHVISNNKIQDMGTYAAASGISFWGGGVLLYNNQYAAVTNNCMDNIRIGIQTGNFHKANPGSGAFQLIDGNVMTNVRRIGVFHNLFYSTASGYTVSNNTITAVNNINETLWKGMLISSQSVPSTITGNVIDGSAVSNPTSGVEVWNVKNTSPSIISGGSVTGVSKGVFINNYDGYPSTGSNAPDGGNASLSNISITNCSTGIHVKDNSLSAHAPVNLSIGSGISISGGTAGLTIENSSASVSASILDMAFSGQAGNYISLMNNSNNVDAAASTFEGNTGGVATLAQNFAIENKIFHKVDNSSLGFVLVKANNDFVTSMSGSVQRGVDAAGNNWTVNVDAGLYSENVIIPKPLILKGANDNVDCTGARGTESIISGTLGSNSKTISVNADNVSIDGFTIKNPLGSFGIYAKGRNNTNIQYNIITDIGNNNSGSDASYGVAIEMGSAANITNVNILNNCVNHIRGGENTSLSGGSAKSNNGSAVAIGAGFSDAPFDVSDLTIEGNTIDHISACTKAFTDGGKGAYGVLINVGAKAGIGKAISPIVHNNEIFVLEGLWAHGVGLEGETPGALVTNNFIDNLIDHKGNTDAIGVLIEDNAGAATVEIHENSFTNMVASVVNLMVPTVDATCNWHGTLNAGSIATKNLGAVIYSPWLINGTDNDVSTTGFQPVPGSCEGTAVSISCPLNQSIPACTDQTIINDAYALWLSSASFSGGCNSALSNDGGSVPSGCGGSKTVTWTVTSLCENPKTCSSVFTIEPAEDLVVFCPADPNLSACTSSADILAAYNTWVSGFSFAGGCNVGTNINLIPELGILDCGGQLSFTYTADNGPDGCQDHAECTATFTVQEALDLVVTCPFDPNLPACSSAVAITNAYNAWKAGFSVSGGCNPISNIASIPSLTDLSCGGSLSFTLIADNAEGYCIDHDECASTFTVGMAPAVVLNCPSNKTENLCQTQAAINSSYNAWLASATFTGGCNGAISNNGGSAPSKDGGSKTVTWTVTSSCSAPVSCTKIFTVIGPDTDCDGVGDACDVCPGGNDKIDNNGDGKPDCKYPPAYNQIIAAWKCGNNKVYVCHIPPGNPNNPNTLCIPYSGMAAHIAHGDYLGSCGNANCGQALSGFASDNFGYAEAEEFETGDHSGLFDGELNIYPNPAQDILYIQWPVHETSQVRIYLYNSVGQKILSRQIAISEDNETVYPINIQSYQSGMYFINVFIGESKHVKTFSIIR